MPKLLGCERKFVPLAGSGLASILVLACANVNAMEIPTGNEDWQVRWDNTPRYTLTQRVESQDKAILNAANNNDGDRNFDRGIVSNRLDLLSEFDAIYQNKYGVRVSAAGWYDYQYNQDLDNNTPSTSNYVKNGVPTVGLTRYTDRYFAGPSGELLDAFVFGGFDIGEVPLNVKAGRHSIYWGESLGLTALINGIAYAQMPLDIGKGQAMPGIEAKELFRPLNNISFQVQPTDSLSIAGQYFLDWEKNLFPEGGTYLGSSDVNIGGNTGSLIAGPNRFLKGSDVEPDKNRDWGLSARWSPEWLQGTLGVYYRNFSDRMPQLLLEGAPPANGVAGKYHFAYAEDIDLFGLSLSQNYGGVSVGAELSYRHNMPLISTAVPISAIPRDGETAGARGNTVHGVLNLVGVMSGNAIYDSASWSTELAWSHLADVISGQQFYKGRDGYNLIDQADRNAFVLTANFTPTWLQVFPGVDLSTPMVISSGLSGNSPVSNGGNEDAGSYSFGVAADIVQKYKADLKYVDFFGKYDKDPRTGAVSVANGGSALLKDRGMLTLTLKTTF
ncbi:DUF1302 domain-containing protein [Pseudomonas sp. C32]|uniref:DUF1302 domain-containing protein n=1 Tax=Pseudomonas sp. C32 TaxID=1529208 RepID=UPI0026163565|nr:DUF1302 domain-containing protein [Pseudomonas sp. C32]MDN4546357.1 DUF1302 domain-containing protein [Pseudomonas sp. C32]